MGEEPLVNENAFRRFIFYQYKKITLKDLLQRMLVLLFSCAVFFLLNRDSVIAAVAVVLGGVCVLLCILPFALMPHSPETRFINDGVFFCFLAVLLNLEASQLISIENRAAFIFVFLLILVLGSSFFVFISISSIKKNRYKAQSASTLIVPLLGAIVGHWTATVILPTLPKEKVDSIIAFTLLLLSLFASAGAGSFLRLYYYRTIVRENDGNADCGTGVGSPSHEENSK